MNSRLKLFIVDTDDIFIGQVEDVFITKQVLGIDVVGKATTKNKFFYDQDAILNSDIFIIGASLPDGNGIELVDYIQGNPAIRNKPIIFTVDSHTRSHIPTASDRNVEKIMQKPFSFKDLVVAIKELEEGLNKTEEEDVGDYSGSIDQPGTNDDVFRLIDEKYSLDQSDSQNKEEEKNDIYNGIYTFISPGSTGKSSLIVNIANALRTIPQNPPSVCIVDLNFLYPSISYLFKQDELSIPQRDIYDLSADIQYIDEDLLSKALIKHGPTGMFILNTPPDVESIHKIPTLKSEHIEKILLKLKETFDIVLVDTNNTITESTNLIPIQHSNKTFVILEPNYINVVGANKILYILKRLEDNLKEDIIDNVSLILNKDRRGNTLDDETVKTFLENKEFELRIPKDDDFKKYLNRGEFLTNVNSSAAQSVIQFANLIYPFQPGEQKRRLQLPFFGKR